MSIVEQAIEEALKSPSAGRLFAIVGPNGAGKSRVLIDIRGKFRPDRGQSGAVYLPAHRNAMTFATTINPHQRVTPTPPLSLAAKIGSLSVHLNASNLDLSQYFEDALIGLWRGSRAKFADYRAAGEVWLDGDRSGPPPSQPSNPYGSLCDDLKSALDMEFKVTSDKNPSETLRVMAVRLGTEFDAKLLSDGQKEIASLVALKHAAGPQSLLFLIDEPELHLNERAAVEKWAAIEQWYPNSVFLYATHSMIFATRTDLTATFFIDGDGQLSQSDAAQTIPRDLIESVVGARVQLLRSADPPLYCEDGMLEWIAQDLLGEGAYTTIVMDGWEAVERSVRAGVPALTRTSTQPFGGLIDRDTRSDIDLAPWEARGLFSLPFYDAEAVLLHPDLAQIWYRPDGKPFPRDDYISLLVECACACRRHMVELVAKQFSRRLAPTISFIDMGELGRAPSIRVDAHGELETQFQQRISEIDNALQRREVETILKLVKGDKIYKRLRAKSASSQYELPTVSDQKYSDARRLPGFREALCEIGPLAELATKLKVRLGL